MYDGFQRWNPDKMFHCFSPVVWSYNACKHQNFIHERYIITKIQQMKVVIEMKKIIYKVAAYVITLIIGIILLKGKVQDKKNKRFTKIS